MALTNPVEVEAAFDRCSGEAECLVKCWRLSLDEIVDLATDEANVLEVFGGKIA